MLDALTALPLPPLAPSTSPHPHPKSCAALLASANESAATRADVTRQELESCLAAANTRWRSEVAVRQAEIVSLRKRHADEAEALKKELGIARVAWAEKVGCRSLSRLCCCCGCCLVNFPGMF